ncbi:hypothetical protein LV79_003830 [Actinokineospora globicatena]|nr:hypothetical protein [Actinokineospora globicatena]GLW78523.1 hypothetical protein Aglo01_30050 [Actinokineospora globicatena]GLW84813.1 hypothetical protein Aglo02_24530 [Actinokineospora globicatena]
MAREIEARRFQVDERTDYLYAFYDFVRHLMRMDGGLAGFQVHANGSFQVDDERTLDSALDALARQVWAGQGGVRLILVEFARSDMRAAFQRFGPEVLAGAHVIHVTASDRIRAQRLARRAEPPQLYINGEDVVIRPADNHALPSNAAQSLYTVDDLAGVRAMRQFDGRVHHIDNDADELDRARLDARLDAFLDDVLRPYHLSTLPGH